MRTAAHGISVLAGKRAGMLPDMKKTVLFVSVIINGSFF